MGSIHRDQHPATRGSQETCCQICLWWLQNHQQPQSDDCWTWMGASANKKSQRQASHDIQDNVWSHWHSSTRLSASFYTEHQRQHPALYYPLLQDGYLPTFILPIRYQTVEPIAGSHCDFPNAWCLQVGACQSGLDNNYEQTDFILFLTNTLLIAPHDVLVHSSSVRWCFRESHALYRKKKKKITG